MEKVIKPKRMILWIIGLILYFVAFIFLIEYSTNQILQKNSQIIFVISSTLILIIFLRILKNTSIKMFQGKPFQRIELIDKYSKSALIVLASLIFILAIQLAIFSDRAYIIYILTALFIYQIAFTQVVYISEDLLIYNNDVLKIKEIDKYKKENQFMKYRIRVWVKEDSFVFKINNVYKRDKIFKILNNTMIQATSKANNI